MNHPEGLAGAPPGNLEHEVPVDQGYRPWAQAGAERILKARSMDFESRSIDVMEEVHHESQQPRHA